MDVAETDNSEGWKYIYVILVLWNLINNMVARCLMSLQRIKECFKEKELSGLPELEATRDIKKGIEDIVRRKIKEHKSNLAQVKDYITRWSRKLPSSMDVEYIERSYIKYCLEFWLMEVIDTLEKIAHSKERNIVQKIFKSLDTVQNLSDIPEPFRELPYYKLLIEPRHIELINDDDRKNFINQFKKECLKQVVAFGDSAAEELDFIEAFVDFLSSSKSLQTIIAELKLKEFCCDKLSFSQLLEGIMKLDVNTYGANLIVLQNAAKYLQQEKQLFMMDKFKESVVVYMKPVQIQERKIDGRLVIEATGKNILLSEVLEQLKNKLSENSTIEEVRFIGGGVVHIDEDLKDNIWQGKNLVILTKTIRVHAKVTWDVSGKDNNHTYIENAGTGSDGHGKPGADGYAGESGGNVLILAEIIEGQENFTVISNGGNGSKGQDGGNGNDGKDGKSLTMEEFKEKFPPAARFGYKPKSASILKTFSNIKKDLKVTISEWYDKEVILNSNIIEEVIRDSRTANFYARNFPGNIYIKAMTNQGNEITFSFEHGGGLTNCQAFFLFKGSLGEPGGHGGEYGLGGQGGYAGEITIKNPMGAKNELCFIKSCKDGIGGENGQGGLYGKHGKNGWDVGYLDYEVVKFFTGEWPKFYGSDLNSKLSLEFQRYTNTTNVFCPYRRYNGYRDIYATIKISAIEHKKQNKYEERKNTRQNNDRKHHAQAVRKKNISHSSILASYSHHLNSTEMSTLQNLHTDLGNTRQQALEAIIDDQAQQQQQNIVSKIWHNFTYERKKKCRNSTVKVATSDNRKTTEQEVNNLFDKLKRKTSTLDDWFQLKVIELNFSELNRLFLLFESLKENSANMESPQNATGVLDLEKFLIDKYRLATLQEVAQEVSPYQEVSDNIELTAESAAMYLTVAKENDIKISHATLGTLNQYLYENNEEQRKNILQFITTALEDGSENREILKHSLKMFILEEANAKECTKKYFNEHKKFLEKQERSLNIFSEAFISELSKPKHKQLFNSWIDNIEDISLIRNLEIEFQKDNFLKALYSRFSSQLSQEYDWNECCKDQAILEEYSDFIQENGQLTGSYRELLAYIFDINIRLYAENEDNMLFLQGEHNPASKQCIHILCRSNKFTQLSVDENYLKLKEERKKKDCLYAKIFAEIKTFKEKQEFDDYLKNKAFLTYHSSSGVLQSLNEKENIEMIIEYFPAVERNQIKMRLDKITSQYIGQQEILYYILKRFSSEGRHVSAQELFYLINSILSSVIKNKKELNIFCWIVAAYPQNCWIDELILIQLENYFKRTLEKKADWRKYLSKIDNKHTLLLFQVKLDQLKLNSPVSTICIEDTLHLLSSIPNETVNLEALGLSEWPYALKEKYWTSKLSKLVDWEKRDLSTASYYLLSVENIFGTNLVEKLLEALEGKQGALSPHMLTEIFSNFYHEKWHLSEAEITTLQKCGFKKWVKKLEQKFTANEKERNIKQLVELIEGNANTSRGISAKLPEIEDTIKSICDKKYAIGKKSVASFTEDDIKHWTISGTNPIEKTCKEMLAVKDKVIGKKCVGSFAKDNINRLTISGTKPIEKTRKEMLAVIDRAIVLKRGFKLRDTQKLTVLALLANNRSTLAQVSTGEGKSLIVVAASIIKALRGEQVHIITSSSVLAKRDAEDNKDIYALFNINVTHNCSEDIEKRKEAYSGHQVVYGDLSNFQRDYLLDKFYGRNIFGDHKFENVIVDEVDSMLLDKGNNMLYLSHDLAGLDKLESIYIYIWQWINRPARDRDEISYAFDIEAIKEAIISDLYGLVKKEDIGKLGSELSEQQKNTIWQRLIKAKILNEQGQFLKENINNNELDEILCKKILSPEFLSYTDRLIFLLKECIEREQYIHVPRHLKSFIEQHLDSWIKSAITAFVMKAGQDYVVDVDRTATTSDRNPNITILDRDTGTDQANSQWDEALHQFLQIKHGCKLSLQSLKAVFISNVSFFKLYRNLYGLTGTLGSQRERDLLQEIYESYFITIPTAKSKQFYEYKPILCTSEKDWIKHVCDHVNKLIEKNARSVLIICETINDVEVFHKAFGGKYAKHVHTYIRDHEEFDIVSDHQKLQQGQIIISTNLAGRGTDIKITEGLRKSGGLHVCLTYLPSNIRIEQQAFGRAARSGEKGSGQLIILGSRGQEYSNLKILDLKKERDAEEINRISGIKTYYETQISVEESCFQAFKEQYEKLKKDLDVKEVPTEVKGILLQSCLDKWTFWLDENSKRFTSLTDKQNETSFNNLLNEFLSQLKNFDTGAIELSSSNSSKVIKHDSKSWLAWVEGNPAQMIKLGKYLSQNKQHNNALENAVKLFDQVIEKEPYFSQVAHYYKALALSKQINWEQQPLQGANKKAFRELKKELRETARLLEEHTKFAMNAAGIVGKIKKNNNESIIQIDAYEEQQKSFANIYYMFSRNINDILGHTVTPQSFINSDIKEELAKVLYKDLLRKDILKKSRVKKNISKKELEIISSGYGISFEALKDFLSNYEGKEISIKDFQKALKQAIPLPSKEAFWKLLIREKVLSEEVKYVVVDNEKLREIDPSLLDYLIEKVNKKDLKKQTLKLNSREIFLNAEWIEQQTKNGSVFKKDDFIKIIGKSKYQILKAKTVLSFNRRSRIDPSRINSTTLTCYQFITLEDFSKVNITKSEAKKILAELVEQKVLKKKDNSEYSAYELQIGFDEIKQIQLRSCLVYENAVRILLNVCFTYKKALEKMASQLGEKKFPISLQLMSKPHQSLVFELFERNIIKSTTVTTKNGNIKEKLQHIYHQTMTKDNFKLMLSQEELIPEECMEELFNCLIERKWIIRYNPLKDGAETLINSLIGPMIQEKVPDLEPILGPDFFYINSSDKRQAPLNFFPKGSRMNIDKTVDKVLDNRVQLIKEETIKHIIATLEQSRSSLKALKVPDFTLKPLTELCDLSNADEMYVFSLNGLDHLLQLGEKKWTQKMLVNTLVVTVMGISQIAIGTAIELYSVGAMTHVGAAFISEGVSDLFFAVGALRSGHFSWEDYGQHKLESLMLTAVTCGIGACLSRGAKVSRFGQKVAGPGFEVSSKEVAKMSGTRLIKTVGGELVGKEVAKRIALKATGGVAFGLANAGVDTLVENCLQGLCKGIASSLLSNIEQEIGKHNIFSSFKDVYETLGEKKARKIMNDVMQDKFTEESYFNRLLLTANNIVRSVTQGIAKGLQKTSKTSNNLAFSLQTINKVIVWQGRLTHIYDITKITGKLLDDLDRRVKSKLKSNKLKENAEEVQEQNQEENEKEDPEKNYEALKKELIDQWKLLLCEKAEQVITQHIVKPILNESFNNLVTYIGKRVQEGYYSYKESEYFEQFEEAKQKYQQELSNASEQPHDNTSQTENHITEKYHKELLKLMSKSKSPKLFAAIVRENVPMDMTCVKACAQVMHKMLEQQDIKGLTITVEGEGGIRQTFSTAPQGEEGLTIKLELKDNHFQLHGNCMSTNNTNSVTKNNCLFEALSEQICLNMTPESFRATIANCIEEVPEMQHHIQQGWHKLPLKLGAFGGRHVEKIPADELRRRIIDGKIRFSQSSIGDHTSDKGGRKKMHIGELATEIEKRGWDGKPIKAVKKDDCLIVLDHRRTVAVATTQSNEVEGSFVVYEPDDEFSSETCEKQYGTRQAGEAVEKRMRSGSLPDFVGLGFASSDVRIRITKSNPDAATKLTLQKLEEMNFQVGGSSRKLRSKSADRFSSTRRGSR